MRGLIREFVKPLIETRGYLTTRVLHEKSFQTAFIERIGFRRTWSDDQFSYFYLGSLPFERKQ